MTGIRRVSQLGTTGVSAFVDGSVVLGTDTTGNYVSTVVAGTAIGVSGATGNVTVTNSGVTALTTSSGLSTNTSATGAVSVTNTGVTALTTSSGLSTNTSATGAVSVTNTGVTSVVAGTGVSVSGATGAVTLSIGQSVATSAEPTFSTIYSNSWFRSNGSTGWYNQTYGGGIYMEDSTYVRVYGSKRFYASAGLHTGIQYGNYGSMSVWSKNNGWAGINFPENAVTWMQLDDSQFGVYRQNSTWNFYYYYGSFTASDSRYKREIKPLEYGLNLINALKPVEFKRLTERNDDDPEAVEEEIFYGFLAQDIKEALDSVGETRDTNLWDLGGPEMPLTPSDRQYINEIELVPPIVKALQELDARLKVLEGGI
jgi:hypothetical protein